MINAQFGKIKYFPQLMAVYRIQGQGNWSGISNSERLFNWLMVLNNLIEYFSFLPEVKRNLVDHLFTEYKEYEESVFFDTGNLMELQNATNKIISTIPAFFPVWFDKCYLTRSKRIKLGIAKFNANFKYGVFAILRRMVRYIMKKYHSFRRF